jgi:Glutathione S-transferase, N-terminal domain
VITRVGMPSVWESTAEKYLEALTRLSLPVRVISFATVSEKLTLFVCHIDDGGPPPHACKRAQRALRGAGHDFDKVVAGKGIPFGLFTTGKRPELKELSGQEKLPVLRLEDGSTINGSANIIAWARSNAPAARPGAAG